MLLDWLITMWLGQVGCQCTCPTGLQADENSQVRLETKTTNTGGVADWMAPRKKANHQLIITANGQKNRDGSRAFRCSSGAYSQIQCWSPGFGPLAQSRTRYRPWLFGPYNTRVHIVARMVKDKQTQDTSVCFNMLICCWTKRGRVEIEEVAQGIFMLILHCRLRQRRTTLPLLALVPQRQQQGHPLLNKNEQWLH